jgi:hypothetical protein
MIERAEFPVQINRTLYTFSFIGSPDQQHEAAGLTGMPTGFPPVRGAQQADAAAASPAAGAFSLNTGMSPSVW